MKTPTASMTPQAKVDNSHFLDALVIAHAAYMRGRRIRRYQLVSPPDFHMRRTVQKISFLLVLVDRVCIL